MKCKWHLCNEQVTGRRRVFCSERCKNKYYVDKRRKALKRKAVDYKGGRCVLCGYDKTLEALSFHHVGGKDFGISSRGHTRSWERVIQELDACILVCHNCHAEIHAGLHDDAALLSNE
jgi:endogenous inhibitor of DNA gyrase (YacG/DUF329 family)